MRRAILLLTLLGSGSVSRIRAGVIHDYSSDQQQLSHQHQLQHQHQLHQQLHLPQYDASPQPKQQLQPLHGDVGHGLAAQAQHAPAPAPADHASNTNHDHKVEHKHAISHQSFKIHHYHPVPVYVKKDKHPIEIGGVKHKLKQVHPETEKHHGYGLVLENHTDHKHHEVLTDHHPHHEPVHQHHHPHHSQSAEPHEHVSHVSGIQSHSPAPQLNDYYHHQQQQPDDYHNHQPLEPELEQEPEQHDEGGPGADYSDEATSHYQYHDINTQHGHHY